ncbi:hypothetical protein TSUD_89240 [Trifolium subterraneum]|uniref:Uncharacterized protein n=1 Tax=Trifolium subterraneum TaxID=3900 RepID=A0A2Z6LM86_TRISU|nr:hypothetical protein TSUD_89240 [Trifolium subterraneum]
MTHSIKQSKKKTKKRSESSSSGPQVPVKVWQPGVDKLEEDEELQCDPSAYNSLHDRGKRYPLLMMLSASFCIIIIAEKPWNSIGIFKVSNISGKRRELLPKHGTSDSMDDEDSDSEDDSEDEEEGGAGGDLIDIFILFTPTVAEGNSQRLYQPDTLHDTKSPHMCILGRIWLCAVPVFNML